MRRWILYGIVLMLLGAGTVAGSLMAAVWWLSRDLPDHEGLEAYSPPVLSRVHAGDGSSVATFAHEQRVFVPIEEIPDLVKHAFVSAEDRKFYHHAGVDPRGIIRAMAQNVFNVLRNKRLVGASTITQQVAKNMLLSGEVSIKRKIREGILAVRLGRAMTKERVLELYLNEIFLGQRSFGVAAAAAAYFDKSLDDLELHEIAYLAALPKGPNNYHPVHSSARALARRSYVLEQMQRNGYIGENEARHAKARPLGTVLERPWNERPMTQGRYFVEELRRQLIDRLGEEVVYEGGLSIRSTLSRAMQVHGARALRAGLERFDRKRGYTGPVARIEGAGDMSEDDWQDGLRRVNAARDVPGWSLAVVLALDSEGALIGVENLGGLRHIPLSDVKWARPRRSIGEQTSSSDPRVVWEVLDLGPRPRKPADVWTVGDVVHVAPLEGDSTGVQWSLRQIPAVQGAFVAMDPRTGRVLAMQGGFSFDASSFNRATQARRQPGSSFKPIIYAAALDRGIQPNDLVLDAPLALVQGAGLDQWRPRNFSDRHIGPAPLRRGLEESRNLMTVRVALAVGLEVVADYAERLGLYDEMPLLPAYALGAGETTLMRLVRAFAVFANGGKRVEPTLIDRIQDRRGATIERNDHRLCLRCREERWLGQEEPYIPNEGETVLDPVTAFQVASMLEGVIERGTGKLAAVEGIRLAGKTGTTNSQRDAWLIAFTSEVVAGCFIGYDEPQTLGKSGFGGTLCGPVMGDFFYSVAPMLTGGGATEPSGVVYVNVDRDTGMPVPVGETGGHVVREAFRENNAPAAEPLSLDAFPPVQSGTGGLY